MAQMYLKIRFLIFLFHPHHLEQSDTQLKDPLAPDEELTQGQHNFELSVCLFQMMRGGSKKYL